MDQQPNTSHQGSRAPFLSFGAILHHPTVLWLLAGVAIALIGAPVATNISITPLLLGVPIVLGYALVGVILMWKGALAAAREPSVSTISSVAATAGAAAVLYAALPYIWATGNTCFDYARFAVMLPTYESVVEQSRSLVLHSGRSEIGGTVIEVDEGPPVRLAFSYGGLLDNWGATVYDPTGEVTKARGFTGNDPQAELTAPAEIRRLFGGDLVHCYHLWKHYYRCSFT